MATGIEIQSPEYKREDLYVSPFIPSTNQPNRNALTEKAALDIGAKDKKSKAFQTSLKDLDDTLDLKLFGDKKISPTITVIDRFGSGTVTSVENPNYKKAMEIQQKVNQLKAVAYEMASKNDPNFPLKLRSLTNRFQSEIGNQVNEILADEGVVEEYNKGLLADKNAQNSSYRYLQQSNTMRAFSEGKVAHLSPMPISEHIDIVDQLNKSLSKMKVEGKTTERAQLTKDGLWYVTKDGATGTMTGERLEKAVDSAFTEDPTLRKLTLDSALGYMYDLRADWNDMTNVQKKKKADELGITLDEDNDFDPYDVVNKKADIIVKGMQKHIINTNSTKGQILDSKSADPFPWLRLQADQEKEKAAKFASMGAVTQQAATQLNDIKTYGDVLKSKETAMPLALDLFDRHIGGLINGSDEEIKAFMDNLDFANTMNPFTAEQVESYIPAIYNVLKKEGIDLSKIHPVEAGKVFTIGPAFFKELQPGAFKEMLTKARDLYSRKPELFTDIAIGVLNEYSNTPLPKDFSSEAALLYPEAITFTTGDSAFSKAYNAQLKDIAKVGSGRDMNTGKTMGELMAAGKSIESVRPIIRGFSGKPGLTVELKDKDGKITNHTIFPEGSGETTLSNILRKASEKVIDYEGSTITDRAAAYGALRALDFPKINITNIRNKPITRDAFVAANDIDAYNKLPAVDDSAIPGMPNYKLRTFNIAGSLGGVVYNSKTGIKREIMLQSKDVSEYLEKAMALALEVEEESKLKKQTKK